MTDDVNLAQPEAGANPGQPEPEANPEQPEEDPSPAQFDDDSRRPESAEDAGPGQAEAVPIDTAPSAAESEPVPDPAAERDEYRDLLQRKQAEFDNYKKRVERDRARANRQAEKALIVALLPLLDDFERALGAPPVESGDAEAYRDGIELIHRQLLEISPQARGYTDRDGRRAVRSQSPRGGGVPDQRGSRGRRRHRRAPARVPVRRDAAAGGDGEGGQGVSKRDYYEVLGVSRDVGEQELKSAYRKLALQYHPDRNPNDRTAEERFKEAAEAYAVLADPDKRARYDKFGHAGVGGGGAAGFRSVDVRRLRGHLRQPRRHLRIRGHLRIGPSPPRSAARRGSAVRPPDLARGRRRRHGGDTPGPARGAVRAVRRVGRGGRIRAGDLPAMPRSRTDPLPAGLPHRRAPLRRMPGGPARSSAIRATPVTGTVAWRASGSSR